MTKVQSQVREGLLKKEDFLKQEFGKVIVSNTDLVLNNQVIVELT